MTRFALILEHRWKLLGVLLATLLLAAPGVRWWRGPQLVADTVVRRDFVQAVVASGHVETPHRVDIGAQITGTVVRVPVAEGQSVRADDALVELESSELRAAGRQAEVAVKQAQTRLRQMREVQAPVAEQALRQAQANLDNARSTLRRSQDLFQQGFIGGAALGGVGRQNVHAVAPLQLRAWHDAAVRDPQRRAGRPLRQDHPGDRRDRRRLACSRSQLWTRCLALTFNWLDGDQLPLQGSSLSSVFPG